MNMHQKIHISFFAQEEILREAIKRKVSQNNLTITSEYAAKLGISGQRGANNYYDKNIIHLPRQDERLLFCIGWVVSVFMGHKSALCDLFCTETLWLDYF